jgi:signal transduction histidine kinase
VPETRLASARGHAVEHDTKRSNISGDPSGGSGLGLASVDSLVRQMSGQISLHNRIDRSGLIARVILPSVAVPSVTE